MIISAVAINPFQVIVFIFVVLSVLLLVPIIIMRIINNNFTNRGFIRLNKTYKLAAKRIENRIACYELYNNNMLVDFAEEVNSFVFKHYIACRDGYYIISRFGKSCEFYGIDQLPNQYFTKFNVKR